MTAPQPSGEPTVVPALELDHVDAGYRQSVVVRDASLVVQPGSVVALLGPNGAGKTTILRTAAGLLRAKAGSVRLHGEDITSRSADRISRGGLCLLPEGRGVYRSLSVRDNLKMFGGRKASFDQVVAAFPVLGQRMNQTAGTLSGGEQQLLAISRAYLTSPSVLLLDELSMGLSPRMVETVLAAVRGLAATGIATLLVEQYVDDALAMADHVYVLRRGAIGFSGTPSQVDRDELVSEYFAAT